MDVSLTKVVLMIVLGSIIGFGLMLSFTNPLLLLPLCGLALIGTFFYVTRRFEKDPLKSSGLGVRA